jgi:tripartite-type tricarboxylate transporter receptor subunit TctC
VPYRGTAAALTDAAAGNVQFTSDTVVTALPLIQEGRVRAIAVSSAERSPLLPEVPAMAEAGLTPAGFDLGAWQGILAPAKVPPAAIARLNAAVAAALADPDVRARLAAQGAKPTGGSAADYAAYLQSEIGLWTKVVADSGATAD